MARFDRISKVILVAIALISLIPAQAQAAMSANDAKRLKTMFTQMVENSRTQAKAQGGDLLVEGDVMVEPGDNYYAVTLPHLTSVQADKSKINIGMVSINAVPGDKKEEWKMTVALPTPITMYDAEGKEDGVLEIGSQTFAGVFQEEFMNFVRLNGKYQNVTFTDKTDGGKIAIPELTLMYDLKEGANKLWSGPMNARAINILAKTGTSIAKIGSIDLQSTLKGYSIAETKAYQEKMAALLESTGKDTPSLSGQHVRGMYNMIFDYMTKAWDGFGSTLSINNVEFGDAPQAGKQASTLKIAKIAFGLDGDGFRQDKVALRNVINLTDLTITPQPQGLKKAAPSTINLDITFNNLPLKKLADLGGQSLGQTTDQPGGSGLVAMNAVANVQKILADAGTTIVVKDTRVANPSDYDMLMNGSATASTQAAMMFAGKTRLEIFGIEKLIGYAQQASIDPTVPDTQKARAAQLLQTLTIMQMMGQQAKNAKGQDIRSYDLVLTTAGNILLNGADLSTVMGGAKPTP